MAFSELLRVLLQNGLFDLVQVLVQFKENKSSVSGSHQFQDLLEHQANDGFDLGHLLFELGVEKLRVGSKGALLELVS